MQDIHLWALKNRANGRNSVLSAYSLGKAQRLIHSLSALGHKFYVHGSIYNMHEALKNTMQLPDIHYLRTDIAKEEVRDGIIIVTPSSANSTMLRKWQPYSLGICSGWMQVRGAQRRRNADAGFTLSDHADWPGLLSAIRATEAECVYVTHGFSAALSRFLKEEYGLRSGVVKTAFGEDEE